MCRMMTEHEDLETLYDKLTQELRRGVLVLAALSQLKDAKYGYALISDLAGQGLEVDQGTLYPLLRRLESQGLLESQWNIEESRPRRYYLLSPLGRQVLARLSDDWRALDGVLARLLEDSR